MLRSSSFMFSCVIVAIGVVLTAVFCRELLAGSTNGLGLILSVYMLVMGSIDAAQAYREELSGVSLGRVESTLAIPGHSAVLITVTVPSRRPRLLGTFGAPCNRLRGRIVVAIESAGAPVRLAVRELPKIQPVMRDWLPRAIAQSLEIWPRRMLGGRLQVLRLPTTVRPGQTLHVEFDLEDNFAGTKLGRDQGPLRTDVTLELRGPKLRRRE